MDRRSAPCFFSLSQNPEEGYDRPVGRPAPSPVPGEPAIDSKTLASAAAQLAEEKKAEEIQIIEVGERLKVAEYFVLITGQNRTHVRALYDELHVRLKAVGEQHRPVEGSDLGWWIVLDYGDVVVHVMQPEAREYYDLDRLYGDCPRLDDWAAHAPDLPLPEELASDSA